jgi:aminomethyltransferase
VGYLITRKAEANRVAGKDLSGGLKKTPFYDFHLAAGAKMVPFAGYIMPLQYTGITEEHLAVRNNVGLFDISHMGEFEVSGPGALEFMQRMTVNDVSRLKIWDIQYNCMCYPDGGLVDDFLLYRLQDRYMMVVNASNQEKDFDWLKAHLDGGVMLKNISDDTGMLAVQGPSAQKVVSKMSPYDFDSIPYYGAALIEIEGSTVLISRTGYTGEDGFEIYIPGSIAGKIWNVALRAGTAYNIQLIGLGARDTLRLEMRMALYGHDIDQTTNPIEAGLAWVVNLDKGDFVGREALQQVKQNKPSRRLVCLEMEARVIPRQGHEILSNGRVVGRVTSGAFSPSLEKPIAMGYVPLFLAGVGSIAEVRIRERLFPATVVKPPFYKKGSHR